MCRCPTRPCTRCGSVFCAIALYGIATLAHGSGFLAVFVAGSSETRRPYKREVERFHSALASLGEIVAFVVLGLTIDLTVVAVRTSGFPVWSWDWGWR